MILCRNLTVASYVMFTTGIASVHSDKEKFESSQCPGQDAHDVNSPDCEWSGEIDRLKRVSMLHSLLLKEPAVPALGDDLHRVIISCGAVETMSECFFYDRALL
jgi:hypothetical protein